MLNQIQLYHYLTIPRAALNRYKGEKRLHLEVIQYLIPLTVDGKLKAVWFHPANESIKSPTKGIGFNIMLKMMGKLPGVPDLIFMWKDGAGGIELKAPKGILSDNQKLFKQWCSTYTIPIEVAKSWTETETILKKWRVL